MRFIIIAVLLSFSHSAFADDDDESKPKVIYKERTEIDFEGVELTGEIIRPSGSLILTRRSASFNPLIKLRTDFDDEMHQSVDEVK